MLKKLKKVYVYGEHDDYIKMCSRMDIYPITYRGSDRKFLGCNGIIYEVLHCTECYSAFTITLMQLPEMNVDELLFLLKNTKD